MHTYYFEFFRDTGCPVNSKKTLSKEVKNTLFVSIDRQKSAIASCTFTGEVQK